MCTHPIRIKNPTISWTTSDLKYVTVPCGHCAECRRRKQNDWYLRASQEAMLYKRNGGHVYMATLTYKNSALPHFQDEDVQFTTVGFFLPHIRSFLLVFRLNVQRTFNVNPSNIKFFIACEFGERTHRPHYHALVYIPFGWFTDQNFIDVATKTWKHGFVMKDKDMPFEVQTMNAVQYVCKYVTKDLYFYDKQISEYLDKYHLSTEEYKRRKEKIKDYLPRLSSPKNFGLSILDEIKTPEDLCNNKYSVITQNGTTFDYPVPQYIKFKLNKTYDSSVSHLLGRNFYRNSEFGTEYQKQRFKHQCFIDLNTFNDLSKPEFITLTLIPQNKSEEKAIKDLSSTLCNQLKNVDIQQLSIYRNLLRNLPDMFGRHKIDYYFQQSFIEDTLNNTLNDKIPFELYSMIRDSDITLTDLNYDVDSEIGLPTSQIEDFNYYKTLSQNPVFQDLELASILIDYYNNFHSLLVSKKKTEKDKLIKEIKEFYKKYKICYSSLDKYNIKST